MLDFDSYKQEKGIPIYLQLIGYIKSCIASGTVCDGDELPSRRWLSARLAINPNTVQKAFAMLEEEGLIVSRGGSGSVFTLPEEKIDEVKKELLKEGVRVDVDSRSEKIGYKIREAQLAKIPYMVIIGDKEVEENKIGVRVRGEGDIGQMEIKDFVSRVVEEINNKKV